MPLVVMVGLPCAGKSTRASEIAALLDDHLRRNSLSDKMRIVVINEESLNIDRAESYQNANEEKKARGALMSAVERALAKDTIVILDSMNYIKGYRYQLHCVSKNLGTTQCTVYCIAPPTQCIEWNASRPAATAYPRATLDSLLTRLEEPDARHRWDRPLLTLLPTDPVAHIADDLVAALLAPAHRPTPNQSTATHPVADTNYLHETDSTVRAVADAVLAAVRDGAATAAGAAGVAVPGTGTRVVLPSKGVSVSEMARMRRQYTTTLNKLEARLTRGEVATGFAEYINTNLR
ncbi:protein KTI12 [Zopfochytrium polystomum]|nr:protein KTI12 [Zopfochytrium polystomum]